MTRRNCIGLEAARRTYDQTERCVKGCGLSFSELSDSDGSLGYRGWTCCQQSNAHIQSISGERFQYTRCMIVSIATIVDTILHRATETL